jgi:signal transduction histidine kinase
VLFSLNFIANVPIVINKIGIFSYTSIGVHRDMNLQSKATLTITSVLIALVIIFTIVLKTLLMGGFLSLEQANVDDNMQRVQKLLQHEENNLSRLVVDWAIWDDAYRFVQNHNQQFIDSNLMAPTYEANDIDVILFANRRGQVVYGREYNDETGELEAINPALLRRFTVDSRFMRIHQEQDTVSGLLTTTNKTYLIAVSPVLKSDNSGVSPGIMVMAKRVDTGFIKRLQNILRLDLSIHMNQQLEGEPGHEVLQAIESHGGVYKKTIDSDRVSGYGLANDVFGIPALIYQIDMKRDIYQQGLSTNRYLIAATLVMAFIITILISVLIRKLVVNKIAAIKRRLKQLENNYDSITRLQDLGHDEIGDLSQTINDLLEKFKRTADDLGAAREVAERSSQAKTEFLSQLSHELRTPLNSIIGFAELSSIGPMELTTRENIEQILHAGKHLLGLIEDLLDISKLELGKFEIGEECVNLEALIDDCIGLVTPLARENDISLSSDCPDAEQIFISADYKRLKQVLVNLLTNAIKYNWPGGSVMVACRSREQGLVCIEVKDNGRGIAADMLELIFEAYERGNGKQLSVAGSGIGLSISRKLILAMGGRIGVTSEEGKGSTFWIELNRFLP